MKLGVKDMISALQNKTSHTKFEGLSNLKIPWKKQGQK